MDVSVTPDGVGRYLVSCPEAMEWDARVDVVTAIKDVVGDEPLRAVIVDLDRVAYISSAGLGAVFSLRKYAKDADAKVVIARANATIRRLLDTVNIASLIPVAETLDEARAILDQACADEAN